MNGICLERKTSVQYDGTAGIGYQARFPPIATLAYDAAAPVQVGAEYSFEQNGRLDVVTALPGQVTKIRARFETPGRYVWHCHILSHEDHEMMRVFEVVAAAPV